MPVLAMANGHSSPVILESIVNRELIKISKWYHDNKLSINEDKSNFIVIHRKKQLINLKLTLNDTILEQKKNK